MVDAALLVFLCGLLAISIAPLKIQIVSVLAFLAYLFIVQARPPTSEEGQDRVRDEVSKAARAEPSRAAQRFQDAKAAIDLVADACEACDPSKSAEFAAALDDCMEEYMRVLTYPVDDKDRLAELSLVAHMTLRQRALNLLAEAYVVTADDAAEPLLDDAAFKITALFRACDTVLRKDGKAPRPGPVPSDPMWRQD